MKGRRYGQWHCTLRAGAQRQFAYGLDRIALAGDDGLRRCVEIHGLDGAQRTDCSTYRANALSVQSKNRGHTACAFRHRFLHDLRAETDELERIVKSERAGGDQRRIFTEAMSCNHRRLWPARSAPRAVDRIGCGQHCGLRIEGQIQRIGWAIGDQRADILFQNIRSPRQRFLTDRPPGKYIQHSDGLRSLAGKNKGKFHQSEDFSAACTESLYKRMTAAPQVSAPPTPSIMIVCPRAIRPSRTASSSASGIDADEVLPCWSTVTSIRSRGSPSLRQVPCIMRIFAWWGISQSICAALMRALSSASSATFSRRWTASLKTAWPSIVTNA